MATAAQLVILESFFYAAEGLADTHGCNKVDGECDICRAFREELNEAWKIKRELAVK